MDIKDCSLAVIENSPIKTFQNVHLEFSPNIDQVQFYGDLIVSKDVQGNILIWVPNFDAADSKLMFLQKIQLNL